MGRLFFIGLWLAADREGRLEDRPRKLKAMIFPFDDCNVNEFLHDLEPRGFLARYNIEGEKFIQITNFSKHQTPHIREAASVIPPQKQEHHSEGTTKVVPKHCLGDVEASPRSPDSLIPDKGILISDSNKRADALVLLPEWLSPSVWGDWLAHRKTLKAPMTPKAERMALARLSNLRVKGHDPQQVIETAIMSGWKMFYEPNNANNNSEIKYRNRMSASDKTREHMRQKYSRGHDRGGQKEASIIDGEVERDAET
ncbi:MAG: hypothetical protein HQL56_18655 [Magnetococcales bacterium]|nr:hypothetical protein [Magnetococcales bacterium]